MILLLVQQEECDNKEESSNAEHRCIYAGRKLLNFYPLIDRNELSLELFGSEILHIEPNEDGQENWPNHKDKQQCNSSYCIQRLFDIVKASTNEKEEYATVGHLQV